MQINGDYGSYSHTSYDRNHNHHITQCLHEEKQEQHKEAAAGIKKDTLVGEKGQENLKQEVAFTHAGAAKSSGGVRKGVGFLKGVWDSMGEETDGGEKSQSAFSAWNDYGGTKGIAAVTSAIKQAFSSRIINRWESVREKIRVSISSTLKRFGKGSEAFAALADPKGHFAEKREADKGLSEKKEKSAGGKAEVTEAAYQPDSHLMDSYNKTGGYCQLNENLTYQKNPPRKNPGRDL